MDMEQKSVPGYVPAPVVNPDFVQPEDTEQDGGTESADDKSSSSGDSKTAGKTASKTTTQK